jgi:hypothetical protein
MGNPVLWQADLMDGRGPCSDALEERARFLALDSTAIQMLSLSSATTFLVEG